MLTNPGLNWAKFLLAFLTFSLEAVIMLQIWYYTKKANAQTDIASDIELGDPEMKLKQMSSDAFQNSMLGTTMDET